MKKIINWTFGSFFRTLGRFAFYILLALLLSYLLKDFKFPGLINILDVYAYDASTWLTDTLPIEEADFYNWSSSTSYSHLVTSTSSEYFYTNDSINNLDDMLTYRNIYLTDNISMGSNGVSFVLKMPFQLTSNVLYNVNLYICGSNGTPSSPYTIPIRAGSSYTNSLLADYNYSNVQRVSIGQAGFQDSTASSTYNHCYLYSGLIDTKQSGAYVSFRLTNSVGGQYSVIGMTYDTIGLTNGLNASEVQSIVSNSGLATASSLSQVQSSVNQVQQELSDVNDSIQDQIQADQQNTQDIIDNQNSNSQAQIDSQKVCSYIDKNYSGEVGKLLRPNGTIETANDYFLTDYINILSSDIEVLSTNSSSYAAYCFYDVNKVKISCDSLSSLLLNEKLTIPSNAQYFRSSIGMNSNRPTYNLCKNGNQAMNDVLTNDSIDNDTANSTLNSLDREYSSLTPFSDFINLPLNWIRQLLSSSQNCTPINLPLPYMNNKYLTLPCMTDFWNRMGALGTLVQIVWIAIVGVRIFNGLFLLTCDTLDPNPDKDMTRLRTWEL